MSTTNFLILTDHREHSEQNSLYALTGQLLNDARTATVFVASRGDTRNATFFAGEMRATIYGLRLTQPSTFAFDASGQQFSNASHATEMGREEVVWLRLPPPGDAHFFACLTAYAPAAAPAESPHAYRPPVFINHPDGILETGNKSFLEHFPEYTAEVRRVRGKADVQAFAARHPIVLKPLEEYGGRGLVKISGATVETNGETFALNDWLTSATPALEAGHYLAMKYLKNVTEGDKRILVVNGKILGASLRVPAAGEWLCNVSRGGTSILSEVTPEEEKMIAAVAPVLLAKGVVIFGADTLTDDDGKRVLSELNTNSIGGFPQAEAQTGRPILQQTINGIYDYLNNRA